MPMESGDYLVQVSGGLVVYCDPPTYPSAEEIGELVQDGFRVLVGVHPKIIAAPQEIEHLTRLLTLPAELGEIGIDHIVDQHDQWHYQERQLKALLTLLDQGKALVLHIRGTRTDSTGLEVYMRCLDLLEHRVCSDQKIQVHCFTGPGSVVRD
ncbi:uncharacterized protein LOC110440249 [Mizuhopecten yessoensis]|uniref:uncharacterized protein LOC110440249 n=1 Tax=Mizuhopecten yessoensis TaxID=6573 RepID=UPI000B45772B|nr:uncharacterized protein LOC110440249 [Mizuhopecten yessoensis]